MTAEIAIMNKEAIALGADSAVTMRVGESGQKVFTSANKLFTLSKYQPVGIMIYGSADFMDVPWETIIKIYRNDKLGEKVFETLEEYASDFIAFLDNANLLLPDSVQEDYVRSSIYDYFGFVKGRINGEVRSTIDEEGEITYKEIKRIISEVIKEQYEEWEQTKNVPSIPKSYNKDILKKYANTMDTALGEVFEELPISKRHSNQLKRIAASLFSKFPEGIEREGISGVVIAGFGEKDTFPSLKAFDMEGIANNRLKYKEYTSTKIGFETTASIIAFAQKEMVVTFMEGVDPFYRNMEESYLYEIFGRYAKIVAESVEKYNDEEKKGLEEKLLRIGKGMLEDHSKSLENYRREKYIDPVTAVVSILPRDDLAAMAEAFVNLTSFKRKITTETETVAGPIDVAVISKGDGFVWIKRKHYFKAELNPQFFANYYKEV